MYRIIIAVLGLALAGPASAQAPDVGQLLQGLTSGNQNQDRAVHEAFERGYQKGRQDEARMSRSNGRDRSSSDDYRRDSRDDPRNDPPAYRR